MAFLCRTGFNNLRPDLARRRERSGRTWTSIRSTAKEHLFTDEEYQLQQQSTSRAEWAASVRYSRDQESRDGDLMRGDDGMCHAASVQYPGCTITHAGMRHAGML